jgi:hypothetical protein
VSKRRVGDCPKSDFRLYHYHETLETKGICFTNRTLHSTQPISSRTAEYVTRTLGGVRGSPCQFLAGQSTRLAAGVLVHSPCKTLLVLSFRVTVLLYFLSVGVGLCGSVLFFIRAGDFFNSFCLGGRGGRLFCNFWSERWHVRIANVLTPVGEPLIICVKFI